MKLIMEFIGTFFFVLTIAMTGNPFATAAMLMAWVYIGANISGGHYNPMVSLAMTLRGLLSWQNFVTYSVAQSLGAFVALYLSNYLQKNIIVPSPKGDITLFQAFTLETLLAFVLAFVILVIATSPKYKNNQIFGIVIGFTFAPLALLGAHVSAGIFNPAIALGVFSVGAINGLAISLKNLAMYLLSGFFGGALAAFLYNYFFKQETSN